MPFGLDKCVPLSHQNKVCHWCSGNLNRLRVVFKGKNSERWYDSSDCLIKGEERASHYTSLIKAAGMQ